MDNKKAIDTRNNIRVVGQVRDVTTPRPKSRKWEMGLRDKFLAFYLPFHANEEAIFAGILGSTFSLEFEKLIFECTQITEVACHTKQPILTKFAQILRDYKNNEIQNGDEFISKSDLCSLHATVYLLYKIQVDFIIEKHLKNEPFVTRTMLKEVSIDGLKALAAKKIPLTDPQHDRLIAVVDAQRANKRLDRYLTRKEGITHKTNWLVPCDFGPDGELVAVAQDEDDADDFDPSANNCVGGL